MDSPIYEYLVYKNDTEEQWVRIAFFINNVVSIVYPYSNKQTKKENLTLTLHLTPKSIPTGL